MKLLFIVGTRPNFMKLQPLIVECQKKGIKFKIIHTDQHFSKNMSDIFFKELMLPKPDYNLNVHGGSPSIVIGRMMIKFKDLFEREMPDWVVVFGDVSSTTAAALVAKYQGIKIAHVEAGVRSFNWKMPEEVNRVVVDRISDVRFVPEDSGLENLKKEGLSENSYYVGNIMINTMKNLLPKIKKLKNKWENKNYLVVTLHRNVNVDNSKRLEKLMNLLSDLSKQYLIIFPIHPRTMKRLHEFGLINKLSKNIVVEQPMDYLMFIKMVIGSKGVITDSGGIQCEASYLGIPTITLRDSTEWKTTLKMTNKLLNPDMENEKLLKHILDWLNKKHEVNIPKYWDDKVAERIVRVLEKNCKNS